MSLRPQDPPSIQSSLVCVWPGLPPSCPVQSQHHPTSTGLGGPTWVKKTPPPPPLHRSFLAPKRSSPSNLHIYEGRAGGGGLWACPPRRSQLPSPLPLRPPRPSPSLSLPGFDLCLTTVTSHGLQGSFVEVAKSCSLQRAVGAVAESSRFRALRRPAVERQAERASTSSHRSPTRTTALPRRPRHGTPAPVLRSGDHPPCVP